MKQAFISVSHALTVLRMATILMKWYNWQDKLAWRNQMPEIVYEPRTKKYEDLVRYAIDSSDAFMFLVCDYNRDPIFQERVIPFVQRLKPLLIKTRNNASSWPGSEASDHHQRDIMVYKSHPSALKCLLEPVSLYNWQYPYFPEDLAFFREGYCWLGSTAHEEQGFILLRDAEELKALENLGIDFEYEMIKNHENQIQTKRKEFSEETFKYLQYYEAY